MNDSLANGQMQLPMSEIAMSEFEIATSIPCNVINEMPEHEIERIINVVIDEYYKTGFPYYQADEKMILREFGYLLAYDTDLIELPGNILQQNMMGLGLCNSFHPEMWSVKCRNAKTPMDIFMDRELFYNALRRRIKYSDAKLAPFNIRKSLKVFSGAQGVSNFRPTIAKWVYQKYCPAGGAVLDPCSGYSGRVLGFLSSHAGSYTGVDPSTGAINGGRNLVEAVNSIYKIDKEVELIETPFEEFETAKRFDLVFTSPPYFNVEQYIDTNGTQSHIRYRQYDEWVDKFLRIFIEKSHAFLKNDGYFVVNVGPPITDDTLLIGTSYFGEPVASYGMRLSKIFGSGTKSEVSHKTEPIFVWRKR